MIPGATHCRATATCQRSSSASGRSANQGPRRDTPDRLLVLAQLRGRLPGGLAQELVRVVLRDLARHVARDDAVVGEELGDARDRGERQGRVEPGDADR